MCGFGEKSSQVYSNGCGNVRFFEQVIIDRGGVAWPGEIDLAPDAMYAQIASQCHEPQQAGPGKSPR